MLFGCQIEFLSTISQHAIFHNAISHGVIRVRIITKRAGKYCWEEKCNCIFALNTVIIFDGKNILLQEILQHLVPYSTQYEGRDI